VLPMFRKCFVTKIKPSDGNSQNLLWLRRKILKIFVTLGLKFLILLLLRLKEVFETDILKDWH